MVRKICTDFKKGKEPGNGTNWNELIQYCPKFICVARCVNYEVSVGGNCCSLLMFILGDKTFVSDT